VVVAPEVTTGDVPGEKPTGSRAGRDANAFPAFDKTPSPSVPVQTDDGAWDRCIMAAAACPERAWAVKTPIELHEPYFSACIWSSGGCGSVPGKKLPHGAGFTLEGQPAGDFAARANQIEWVTSCAIGH
jgi:hypothetical protein